MIKRLDIKHITTFERNRYFYGQFTLYVGTVAILLCL